MGEALGVTVIGTVGSDDKVALAKENGCAHVLNVRKDDWVKRVKELTGVRASPSSTIPSQRHVHEFARLSLRARHAGVFRQLFGRGGAIRPSDLEPEGLALCHRPTLASYARTPRNSKKPRTIFFRDRIRRVKIAVNQRFKLADVRACHQALHSR